MLEEIPTIGPKTRAKLIKAFGSVRGLSAASQADIAAVVGETKAALIVRYLPKK